MKYEIIEKNCDYVRYLQDITAYQNRYWDISSMDMKQIVKETECDIPCIYTEYSLPSYMSIDRYKK